MHTDMRNNYYNIILLAKFNLTVQGTFVNDSKPAKSTTRCTTIQECPTSSEIGDGLNTTDSLGSAVDGFQVGSFLFYILIGAGSGIIVVALTTIVILIICLIWRTRFKMFDISLTASQLHRCRQRSSNSNLEEIPIPDIISILPNCDEDLTLEEISPLEFKSPAHSPPSANAEELEVRDRNLPPRKCDQIPIYIFLGPNENDSPFPKAPVQCKNNLAYIHLGPEDSSMTDPSEVEPVTCKHNAAYIHLDPGDASM